RRHRLRIGRPRCAGHGALGNAVALHAGRSRRLQGRSLFLQAGRRHPRPGRADRYEALSAVSAVRRIRLFLHAGGDAGGGEKHSRLRGHHHEGARPLSDERRPAGVSDASAAGAGEDRGGMTSGTPRGPRHKIAKTTPCKVERAPARSTHAASVWATGWSVVTARPNLIPLETAAYLPSRGGGN